MKGSAIAMLCSEHMNVAAEYRFYGFAGYYYGEVRFGAAEFVCAA